jgi:hypothetical protein
MRGGGKRALAPAVEFLKITACRLTMVSRSCVRAVLPRAQVRLAREVAALEAVPGFVTGSLRGGEGNRARDVLERTSPKRVGRALASIVTPPGGEGIRGGRAAPIAGLSVSKATSERGVNPMHHRSEVIQ